MKFINKYVFIKKSKNGKGVFAKKDFNKGEIVLHIEGKLITCDEDENVDEQTRSNTIRFNSEKFLSPKGKLGDFLNHSCKPNSKIVKDKGKLYIYSIKDIEKGEEIFFDYSTILASDDVWTMKCKCREENCRKIIKKFKTLPAKIKKEYISKKIVPKYILEI